MDHQTLFFGIVYNKTQTWYSTLVVHDFKFHLRYNERKVKVLVTDTGIGQTELKSSETREKSQQSNSFIFTVEEVPITIFQECSFTNCLSVTQVKLLMFNICLDIHILDICLIYVEISHPHVQHYKNMKIIRKIYENHKKNI